MGHLKRLCPKLQDQQDGINGLSKSTAAKGSVDSVGGHDKEFVSHIICGNRINEHADLWCDGKQCEREYKHSYRLFSGEVCWQGQQKYV